MVREEFEGFKEELEKPIDFESLVAPEKISQQTWLIYLKH